MAGRSNQAQGGLFSALFGFLAFFFQAAAPAPTVDFSVRDDVFCADEKAGSKLALGFEGREAKGSAQRRTKRKPTQRRRLKSGEYVGEFVDLMA